MLAHVAMFSFLVAPSPATDTASEATLSRAIAFLSAEVPKWSPENKCFSCHNNGDAARALHRASQLGRAIPPRVLADTNSWLSQPDRWEKNGGDGPFSDKRLARIVFAVALANAVETGQIQDTSPLKRAAEKLANDQGVDGSWSLDDPVDAMGSPATYGRPLATSLVRDVLVRADPIVHRAAIARAEAWMRRQPIESVLDASVALLSRPDPGRRAEALAQLARGQSEEGGWGPYANSPSEVFDTALAVLALSRHRNEPGVAVRIQRGRNFLIETQLKDGSWPATTRPTGGESYAQTMSTTGWAVLALLE